MKTLKWLLLCVAVALVSAQAFARTGETSGGMPYNPFHPYYKLVPISNISGGAIDQDGNAQFVIEYSLQPCAETFVKLLEAKGPEANEISVGVLVKNSGVKCAGPTTRTQEHYQVSAPLPAGGAVLVPMINSTSDLQIVNFALSSTRGQFETISRDIREVKVSEEGGFQKTYTVTVVSSEGGIAPNGPSTHPCTTVITVDGYSGIAGPVTQVKDAHTVCAMNSPMINH